MSATDPKTAPAKIRGFFRGLREVAEFLKESVIAVTEVVIGRWPQPFGAPRRKPKPPNQGMGPIEKVAPFPTED